MSVRRAALAVLAGAAVVGCTRSDLWGDKAGGTGGAGGVSACAVDCAAVPVMGCQTSICNAKTHQCETKTAADGTTCDDGKQCTVHDACNAGVCGGELNTCGIKPTQCQQIVCHEETHACTSEPVPDGGPCTPTAACQVDGACTMGTCAGKPKKCGPAPDECHAMSCDVADGQCKPVAANDGASCDAANLCANGKTCKAGSCGGGTKKDCSALTVGCTLGVCQPASGTCTTAPGKDGDSCSNLDHCIAAETCSAGQCGGGTAVKTCANGDKCCPAGCTAGNDGDCGALVSGGDQHTCLRLGGGKAWCWGNNTTGQLGTGSNMGATLPTAVSIAAVGALAAGGGFTCALMPDGTVKCWGTNTSGQLGNGGFAQSNLPVDVSGLSGVVSLAAGSTHACAVLADGTARCWGANSSGQLGNGTTTLSNKPVTVSGLSDALTVSAGATHTCVVAKGGAVKCWGGNFYGGLGDGTTKQSNVPVTVMSIATAVAVSAGYYHTCALLTGGAVNCWGYNGLGSLGNGGAANSSVPVAVAMMETATSLGAGAYHACVVVADGTVRCWGYGNFGQLGNGSMASASKPVVAQGVSGATQVSAGGYHSCAVLGGSVRCWGSNFSGQLGDGTTSASTTPVAVHGL